jgi:regulatory protein
MQSFPTKKTRKHPEPPPLDAARLNALALGYVARFATSASRLEAYLLRKLKGPPGAGWQGRVNEEQEQSGIEQPDLRGEVTALVARFVAAGYVDDEAFAHARSGGLQRRGYGSRHISQALGQAGIAAEVVAQALPGRQAGRQAALALARKRRLGPFAAVTLEQGKADRARREKQIAVLLRAGHPLDSARKLVDAASVEAAEDWARAGEEDE